MFLIISEILENFDIAYSLFHIGLQVRFHVGDGYLVGVSSSQCLLPLSIP